MGPERQAYLRLELWKCERGEQYGLQLLVLEMKGENLWLVWR